MIWPHHVNKGYIKNKCGQYFAWHSNFLDPLHFKTLVSFFYWVHINPLINKGNAKRGVSPRLKNWPCDLDLWPWKSIGFQILLRTNYVPSLVKVHWRMLILECSQGCYEVKIWPSDLWPWKSIGFQIILRTTYGPSLVKIHWRMLILECSQGCYMVKIWPSDLDLWPVTLNINRVPDSPKYVPSLVNIFETM
jgi:hypothetical protein